MTFVSRVCPAALTAYAKTPYLSLSSRLVCSSGSTPTYSRWTKYRSSTFACPRSRSRPTSTARVFELVHRTSVASRRCPGHAHLPGEPVAGPSGQDAQRHLTSRLDCRVHERVGDLVLGAVAAIADDQVDPVLDSLASLGGGIPVPMGDADGPLHLVLAEDVVEHVEDRLVPADAGLTITCTRR